MVGWSEVRRSGSRAIYEEKVFGLGFDHTEFVALVGSRNGGSED